MDSFLYDNGLHHEKVKGEKYSEEEILHGIMNQERAKHQRGY